MPGSHSALLSVGLVTSLVAMMFGRSKEEVQRFAYSQWAAHPGYQGYVKTLCRCKRVTSRA